MSSKLIPCICFALVWHLAIVGTTFAGIIYVDADVTGGGSSWEDAFGNLQDALATASSSDEIWVAEGTYKPDQGVGQTPNDRTATFQLINGVSIYGGFVGNETSLKQRDWVAHETVLSGDIGTLGDSSDNSYHVVTGTGAGASGVLDGFTITGGNANGAEPNDRGAGLCSFGVAPTVANCRFSENSAGYVGGGMYYQGSSSTVTGCTFIGNSVGSGGGGMCNYCDSNPTLTNCIFNGNGAGANGGGMYNFSGCTPTLVNCTFSGNSAVGDGGAMYNWDTGPTLINCTLSANTAGNNAGGIRDPFGGSPTLTNCILWGNSDSGPMDESAQISTGPAVVSYSCIQGLSVYAGNNNIDDNPLFVGGVDYHLQTCSPCIDAGDNSRVPGGVTTDLEGNSRFVDDTGIDDTGYGTPPIVDMGAYESLLVSPNSDHVSYLSPADDARCVDTSVILSWLPGCNSVSYDVYFGTVPGALALVATLPLGQESYDLGVLELCTTYYWRIDDVDGANGDVWSFTTSCPSCCVQPPEGMVAWWPLDETAGPSEDIVGDNDGTWVGSPTPVAGKVDGALNFNGSSQYVSVTDDPSLNFGTGDLSIDAWIRADTLSDDILPIVDKRLSPRVGYIFYLSEGRLTLLLADSDEWWQWNNPSSSDLRDGQWHHVAATVERIDTNGGRLYIDGQVIHTFDPTRIESDISNTHNLWIGRRCPVSGAVGSKWFDGAIDEVELFNRVLDESEILAIFEAGAEGKCKCDEPPVSYVDDVKWSQSPDKNNNGCINGWDELSIYNTSPIIADDWICMDARPITDIHWWGSFKNWTEQTPPADEMPTAFHIGIWTDVPDPEPDNPDTFSHPNDLVWEKISDSYVWSFGGCDMDPREISGVDACFKFDQLLSQDEWFYQEADEPNGTVYWLSIAAIYEQGYEPNFPWGWKTRPHFCKDDAVRITGLVGQWPPEVGSFWENGEPIEYPEGTSWDLAFVLTTNREYAPRKWHWPNEEANTADIYPDGIINFKDLAVIAEQWLEEAESYPCEGDC